MRRRGSAPGANREGLEKHQRAWPTGLSAPPLTGSRHAHPGQPFRGVSSKAQSRARLSEREPGVRRGLAASGAPLTPRTSCPTPGKVEVINARETVPSSPIPALLDQCEQAQPLGIGETLEGHLPPPLRPTPPCRWVRASLPKGQ